MILNDRWYNLIPGLKRLVEPTSTKLNKPLTSHQPKLTLTSQQLKLTLTSHQPKLTLTSHQPKLTLSSHQPKLKILVKNISKFRTRISSDSTRFEVTIINDHQIQTLIKSHRELLELDQGLRELLDQLPKELLDQLPKESPFIVKWTTLFYSNTKRIELYLNELINNMYNCPLVIQFFNFEFYAQNILNQTEDDALMDPITLTMDSQATLYDDKPVTRVGNYQIIKVLGQGAMGKVFLVKDTKSTKLYAMKSITKKRIVNLGFMHVLKIECDILNSLSKINSPFLINHIKSFETPRHLFLVLDYYSGGDLATHLIKSYGFSEDRAQFYTCQIILGLKALHDHGIIYRDLKPENILLSPQGNIVLTDFGLSKLIQSTTRSFCGTAQYMAPEVIKMKKYSFSADWWSLGIVLYEMLTNRTPFMGHDELDTFDKILHTRPHFPRNLSPVTIDFIVNLLNPLPQLRLGHIGDALPLMNHPYFKNIHWHQYQHLKVTPPFTIISKSNHLDTIDDFEFFDDTFLNMPLNLSITE